MSDPTQSGSSGAGPAGSFPLMNPWSDSQLWEKLENDSRTKAFLADSDYREMVTALQKDPRQLGQHMQDYRIMTTLGVLLGVDLNIVDGDTPNGHESMDTTTPPTAKSSQKPKPWSSKQSGPASYKKEISEAMKEKELGNVAYKKKDFPAALTHYNKAIELEPTNIVFRNNRSAVYFEQEDFDKCIEECQQTIDVGREHRADFKLLAKALTRQGNAYLKKDDLENALLFFNKSLSESRDRYIVQKVQEVGKMIKERARLACIDPEKSLQEKQLGNTSFQKGDYPTALKHYTEAIKCNPDDAKLFSNRAACYTKLLEFNMALKDCDKCIAIDPKFVKGYLRKGATLMALKELSKAADAYQKGLEVDPNCQEAIQGYRKCVMQDNDPESVKRRAMQDPEVQEILGDPSMQLILQQMQKDPRALQEHLKNPDVAKKIEKLLEVGLIAIR